MKILFLFYFAVCIAAPHYAQKDTSVIVKLRLKYFSNDAGEVYLIWGINNWQLPEQSYFPENTTILEGSLKSLMNKTDDSFVINIEMTAGTEINYMFLISKDKKGNEINFWESNNEKGYTTTAGESGLVEINDYGELNASADKKNIYKITAYFLLGIFSSIIILLIIFRKKREKYHIIFKSNIVKLVIIILISRIALLSIGYLSIGAFNKESEKNISFKFKYFEEELNALSRSDVQWYLDIAENGYDEMHYTLGVKANWGFYPLWPVLIKITNFIIPDLFIAGLILCNFLFIAAIIALYKLLLMNYSESIAYTASSIIIVFPTSYFFMRPGPESLFLLIAVLTLYYAKKGRWILTGVLLALGAAARFQGILLVLPVLYIYYNEWKEIRKFKPGILSIGLVPVVLILFMWHIKIKTGDPFSSFYIFNEWDHGFALPLLSMIDFIKHPSLVGYYGWNLAPLSFLGMFFTLIILIFMVKNKNIPKEYTIYTLLSLFVILSRNELQASLRYILPVFPIFIILSEFFLKRKFLSDMIIYIFALLQSFYFIAFVNSINWAAN